MSTVLPAPPIAPSQDASPPAPPLLDGLETFADLLHRLGDVPPERVLLWPPPGTATEADVLRLEGRADKRLCELIDGVLVEKAMGYDESKLAIYLARRIGEFADQHDLGEVVGGDGMLRVLPQRIRLPDVSFLSWERLKHRPPPPNPVPPLAPDLAVEVLSPSNTRREMEEKRRDYFGGGTKLVWEVDPVRRIARVYTSPVEFQELTEADALDGGAVLPGFRLPLAEVFARLDRRA